MSGRGTVRVLSPSAVHSSLEAIVAACRGQGGGEVTLSFEMAPALAPGARTGRTAIMPGFNFPSVGRTELQKHPEAVPDFE